MAPMSILGSWLGTTRCSSVMVTKFQAKTQARPTQAVPRSRRGRSRNSPFSTLAQRLGARAAALAYLLVGRLPGPVSLTLATMVCMAICRRAVSPAEHSPRVLGDGDSKGVRVRGCGIVGYHGDALKLVSFQASILRERKAYTSQY